MRSPTLRLGVTAGLVLASAIALLACGGSNEATPTAEATATASAAISGPATIVPVTLTEWSVVTDPAVAPPGPVVVEATNAGTIEHELVIVRTTLGASELPVVDGVVDLSQLEVVGEISGLARGERKRQTFELAVGPHVLICNIPGHYTAGMRLGFTVR